MFIGSFPCRVLFPVALDGVALPVLSFLPQDVAPFLAVGAFAPARPDIEPRRRGLASVAIDERGFWRLLCLLAAVPERRAPRIRPDSPGHGSDFPSLIFPPSSPLNSWGNFWPVICYYVCYIGIFGMPAQYLYNEFFGSFF